MEDRDDGRNKNLRASTAAHEEAASGKGLAGQRESGSCCVETEAGPGRSPSPLYPARVKLLLLLLLLLIIPLIIPLPAGPHHASSALIAQAYQWLDWPSRPMSSRGRGDFWTQSVEIPVFPMYAHRLLHVVDIFRCLLYRFVGVYSVDSSKTMMGIFLEIVNSNPLFLKTQLDHMLTTINRLFSVGYTKYERTH